MRKNINISRMSINILMPIPRKDTNSSSPPVFIRKSYKTVVPHITHKENSVCLKEIYPQNYKFPVFFEFTRSGNLCTTHLGWWEHNSVFLNWILFYKSKSSLWRHLLNSPFEMRHIAANRTASDSQRDSVGFYHVLELSSSKQYTI